MNFEMRLRGLKEEWQQIQALREEKAKAQKKVKEYQLKVRHLAQEIPKRLNKYNEMMI